MRIGSIPATVSRSERVFPDAIDQLTRQSAALSQNPGFRGVIEVPTPAQAQSFVKVLLSNNITNITVRVAK